MAMKIVQKVQSRDPEEQQMFFATREPMLRHPLAPGADKGKGTRVPVGEVEEQIVSKTIPQPVHDSERQRKFARYLTAPFKFAQPVRES